MNDALDDVDDADLYSHEAAGGVLRQTVLMLALGALLVTAWRGVNRTHARRHDRALPLPERLQTWEGEGGRPDAEPPGGTGLPAAEPTIDSPV